jgi:hypothetical protein
LNSQLLLLEPSGPLCKFGNSQPPCVRIVVASLENHEIEGQRENDAMQKRYTEEFRESVVKQTMPPHTGHCSAILSEITIIIGKILIRIAYFLLQIEQFQSM